MSSSNMPSSGSKRLHPLTPRQLKILHIDPEKAWGGGEVQVRGLTTYLHQSGHRSVVATDPRGVLYSQLSHTGLPVLPLRIRNHLDVLAGFRLRKFVQAGQFDIAHFHTARAHALSPWLQGLRVKRLVTRRMDYALKKRWATRFLYLHSSDMVIAISQSVKAALLEGAIPTEHIRVIPSGIDTARFAPDPVTRDRVRAHYGIAPHIPLVLSVGALVERKGQNILIAAAHGLKEQGYNVRYFICGDGALRTDLETQTQELGLAQTVQFLGFCPDISEIQAAADYFVHVPSYEGLGVAVIEALAAGLPTVASKVGGIPELIEDQKTGILVPPKDATALATALTSLFRHKEFARQLGATGQMFVRNSYDVKAMAQANEALYIELLADTI